MPSSTVEDYVKQLYLAAQEAPDQFLPLGQLAQLMGVVPGTATAMMKTLVDSGLAEYAPRTGARLTRGGEQLALHVLRRHRLIELFLVKMLGMDWSEVHREAEELEHAVSDKVLAAIDAKLGSPTVDPHGDPIPTPKGKVATITGVSLADCELRRRVRVARVLDQAPAFLQLVDRFGLKPGTTVRVEDRDDVASAVLVAHANGDIVTLGLAAAEKILVE